VIVGIGIDAVTVSRLEKWAANPALLERFFDIREIAVVRERGKGMVRSLAVRFAAKEAFCKALGTGLAGISLKDIMVLNDQDKKPEMKVAGSALAAMKAAGAEKIFVSLTHEGDMAIASVVLEA
jgi:holo-[acyl-carrier protein] synthase